jgi:hypothetical protein
MARPLKKELLLWTRTLHIYLTMFGLVLLFFFSLTGFALNHDRWFSLDEPRMRDRTAALPGELAKGGDRLALVEYLRKNEGARGEVTSVDEDENERRVQFSSPGRKVEFTVERESGETAVHEETRNALAFLTDLHTGKNAGGVWRRVIDGTAIFLFLASLSGAILWISLPKRRKLGVAALVAGTVLTASLVVWLLV